jgi:hypothetical protein
MDRGPVEHSRRPLDLGARRHRRHEPGRAETVFLQQDRRSGRQRQRPGRSSGGASCPGALRHPPVPGRGLEHDHCSRTERRARFFGLVHRSLHVQLESSRARLRRHDRLPVGHLSPGLPSPVEPVAAGMGRPSTANCRLPGTGLRTCPQRSQRASRGPSRARGNASRGASWRRHNRGEKRHVESGGGIALRGPGPGDPRSASTEFNQRRGWR